MSGSLIIISAPSGAGKTTLLKRVMAEVDRLVFSVSHTTRPPRPGERDGQDYYFCDRQSFEAMIGSDAFLEWARVHDNYYGTALAPLARQLEQDFDVVLDIDVQGASIVREKGLFQAVYIFVAPPGLEELERRLRGRNTEDEPTIAKRLQNARREIEQIPAYEYLVINDNLEDAVRQLAGIIYAERARMQRNIKGVPVSCRDAE